MPDRNHRPLAVNASQTIPLFGGRALDLRQARGVILALSGANVIREWHTLATPAPAPHAATLGRCYAGIAPREPGTCDGRRLVVGRGTTPAGAIEDLLWQLVTPRLLSE